MRSWMFCLIALLASPAFGQVICKDGKCQLANGVVIAPLQEEVFIDSSTLQAATTESDADRLNRIIRATVRVTVSGVCGSGTVVGRDGAGNAIVLTNAHVAGTQKGRIVSLSAGNKMEPAKRAKELSSHRATVAECLSTLHCSSATPISPKMLYLFPGRSLSKDWRWSHNVWLPTL